MDKRICVIGDEIAGGIGDARAMGWVGRVAARSGPGTWINTLTVAGEDSGQMNLRWFDEARLRLPEGEENYLVIAPGAWDIPHGVSLPRSRMNLANILDKAGEAGYSTFVVGPAPRGDLPRISQESLCEAFRSVCERRRVPYAEMVAPLIRHEQWATDMEATGGAHPQQTGYGLMAWVILHSGWGRWLGLDIA